ncbi:MAG TPA: phosphatase PAP2 family protein [Ruminococcus sp.]|nr:phosphatase PAP2 family protein [Ruminococcus sp.]
MDWEFQFLNWIQDHLRSGVMDHIMAFITKFGDGGIFWIAITLLMFIPKRTRKYAHVSAFALIFCVVGGNLLLKNIIARPRPFWLENGNPLARIAFTGDAAQRISVHDGTTVIPEGRTLLQLLVKAPKDFAFPSGHTQASFAAAASICMWKRKWGIPALILAALVAFSRMYLYVHYPTDVLGGMFYGVAYALIALAICNKLFRNKPWDGCEGAKKRRRKRRPQTQQAQQPQHAAMH